MATAKTITHMAPAKTITQLQRLREPFAATEVKTRPGGGGKTLDYVPIETVLERLLDAAPEYSWTAGLEKMEYREGKWTAVVSGTIHIGGKFAEGFGAMTNPDPDMAVKSANSEAMKNAAKNGWGVSLELWNEEYRSKLAGRRALAGGSEHALKRAVVDAAGARLGLKMPTAAEVAEVYEVSIGELADPEVLRTILEAEGVL